jgi:hypothetical protein
MIVILSQVSALMTSPLADDHPLIARIMHETLLSRAMILSSRKCIIGDRKIHPGVPSGLGVESDARQGKPRVYTMCARR